MGSTVIVSPSSSETLVKQASEGLPLILMPQLPQVACRHEYLTAIEWSRWCLAYRMHSRTVVHFWTGTANSSNRSPSLRFTRSVMVVLVIPSPCLP